jgi:hypothetical protein
VIGGFALGPETQAVTESDYFIHLEFRLCGELSGMRDKEIRRHWCDGFLSWAFEVVDDIGRITGKVYLVYDCSAHDRVKPHRGRKSWGKKSSNYESGWWDFVLLLGSGIRDRNQVNWDKLLPGADVTGWLSLDFENKIVTIDPLAAYLDRPPLAS